MAATPDRPDVPLGVVHIAGETCQVGPLLRQRCAWCGALLLELNLERIAVAPGSGPPAVWPVGQMVEVHDGYATVVQPTERTAGAAKLPTGACALLDPAITG